MFFLFFFFELHVQHAPMLRDAQYNTRSSALTLSQFVCMVYTEACSSQYVLLWALHVNENHELLVNITHMKVIYWKRGKEPCACEQASVLISGLVQSAEGEVISKTCLSCLRLFRSFNELSQCCCFLYLFILLFRSRGSESMWWFYSVKCWGASQL